MFKKKLDFVILGCTLLACGLMFIFGYEHRQYVEDQERKAKDFRTLFEQEEAKAKLLEADLKACKKAQLKP